MNKTILLVEDNPDDELLAIRALSKHQAVSDVVIARDGLEACEYLFGEGKYSSRDLTTQPELVLLDLQLPKLGGLDVLKKIRTNKITQLLPVVILTSSKEETDLVKGYELGANSYIRKPVDYDQFVNAVQQLKLYWLVLNESPPTRS